MSEAARTLEEVKDEGIISYSELKEYNDLNVKLKKLEAEKEVMNKKFKKSVGLSVIQTLKDLMIQHEEAVSEYDELLWEQETTGIDQEEQDRLSHLTTHLQAFGLNDRTMSIARNDDYMAALTIKSIKVPLGDLRADFCPQDKSKMNDTKAVAFLKSKNMKHLIRLMEVPDQQGLEAAIYEGTLTAKEVSEACIEEKIIVTLTIRKNEE